MGYVNLDETLAEQVHPSRLPNTAPSWPPQFSTGEYRRMPFKFVVVPELELDPSRSAAALYE
jgi:hypothetical protein